MLIYAERLRIINPDGTAIREKPNNQAESIGRVRYDHAAYAVGRLPNGWYALADRDGYIDGRDCEVLEELEDY